jgi:hypothetical protein
LEDNQSVIKLVHDAKFHHMTKHIDIQYHMVKDFQIQACFISMNYINTQDQVIDVFTKVLPTHNCKHFFNQNFFLFCGSIVGILIS